MTLGCVRSLYHAGMQIRLHRADISGRQRTHMALDVDYNSVLSVVLVEAYHFMANVVLIRKTSCISEYQHKTHFAQEYRLEIGDGGEFIEIIYVTCLSSYL